LSIVKVHRGSEGHDDLSPDLEFVAIGQGPSLLRFFVLDRTGTVFSRCRV